MLPEIDVQGSESLSRLTKLKTEGIRAVRKMSGGYDEDPVNEAEERKLKGADTQYCTIERKNKTVPTGIESEK